MEAITAIKTRKSVRSFLDRKVEEKYLKEILEAGRSAPSGLNNQPWRFVIVEDKTAREKLAGQTSYKDIILNAPLAIAVFLDLKESYDRTKDLQAIGACIQNMLLAVHSLRLGGCWLGEILKNKEEVGKILGTPESYELMAVLAIGHPKNKSRKTSRKKTSELIYKRWT